MRRSAKKRGARRAGQSSKATLVDLDTDDDSSTFESPVEEDGTDYGLEFTTSRLNLQDESNRRTSTQRKNTSARRTRQNQESDSSEEENRDPEPANRRTPGKGQGPVRPTHNTSNRNLRLAKPQPQQAGATGPPRRIITNAVVRAAKMNQEVRILQAQPTLLLPRLPFSRLVRELMSQFTGPCSFRITSGALEALQTSSEMYITQRLQDAYLLTLHRQRVTLEVRDMALMAWLCNPSR
ncbi:histone H3-like centromeric protein cid [Drosophila guanche]|uniref:Blast:Histone H3-like centromeric protein cid n=1 Tax=Drosophila guanche TaxID=7266 RepID=A0A3B0J3D6_DROGU|nr:histone H3-like centromeric protein cid [Drosophila guanche]SPP73753.1 blast:Histone H3-like centromeric protein cid [Drosophila guanche]